jgi:hypothetical protein
MLRKCGFSLHFLYLALAAPAFVAGLSACSGRSVAGRPPTGAGQAEVAPKVAAAAPLRRLTQEQYRHSIRDLLGVSAAGVVLPVDEGTAGFFANTIAPVSELQLEQYARAAEEVARVAGKSLPLRAGCGEGRVALPACAEAFIADFGQRVYRRPLTAGETRELTDLFVRAQDRGDLGSALRAVVATMLTSPHFLYLVEPPAAPLAPGGRVGKVGPFALAARLSYFLWGSAPDAELLAAAAHGVLDSRTGLQREVARLMADARFRDTLASFHEQWLDLTELGGVEKRGKLYPLFSPELRTAMREETIRFVDEVIRAPQGGARLETLLSAPFSMVGEGLYQVYGLGKKSGAEAAWRKVDLGTQHRAGLLTQAAFLTRHAHWDKPSLVLRGKVVRERLLCTELPPPPPDVNNTPPPFDPNVSMRERFEDHRSEVSCARCHRLIDPLGIPFESFDAIGVYRTKDGPANVDPTSELSGTAKSDGPVKDAVELAERLAKSDEVRDCVALQWFRYALGRDATSADATSLSELRGIFRDSGGSVPALVAAIATTDSFRYAEVAP